MTGRNAPAALVDAADYVSEIQAVKHPFEKGIPSRKGIES
jgi:cob(I)alamin adenosyltransferase